MSCSYTEFIICMSFWNISVASGKFILTFNIAYSCFETIKLGFIFPSFFSFHDLSYSRSFHIWAHLFIYLCENVKGNTAGEFPALLEHAV